MLKFNLSLWQRHWNYCSLLPSLPTFWDVRSIFINNIQNINENILSRSDSKISETLLFDISPFNDAKNRYILNTTIDNILSTKRFDVFQFYYLNVKLITTFSLYYVIGLGILVLPCQLDFSLNHHYFYVSISSIVIFFVIDKLLWVRKLPQIATKFHTSSCSINYFVMVL